MRKPVEATSLGVRGIVAAIEAGRLTASAVAEAYLKAIEAREGKVRAFAFLDPALVLEQAHKLDRAGARRNLALRGVPFAVKDIIKTKDQPTACNSPIYRGYRPKADADCVAAVRAAGALIIGKTVTTEFAGRHPGPTRNPLDPRRTPGGSSSGSAAAVAAGFALLAFGTQTGGSVIRPASYCGIVGYKATLGALSVGGIKPLALGFDALGVMAATPDDILVAEAVWQHHRDKLSASFRQTIEKGLAWPHERLAPAWATAHTCLDLLNDILGRYDALVTPAALGEAGVGIAHTGSAACNAMWSLLGPPAVTLPLARGPAGMPIGVQFIGARRGDRRLLGLTDWVFRKLGKA